MERTDTLTHPARIWSFDGGGPSVIFQLIIIDEIMHQIQWNLKLEETPRPCDYAELMVGTGLGAVAVILLARLRLTAAEALGHIINLGQRVFTEPDESTSGPKFDSEKLNKALRIILGDYGVGDDTKMIGDVVSSGHTHAAITTVPTTNLSICRLLRTYHVPGMSHDCSVIDAIAATLAVPEWFSPISIGSEDSREELIGGGVSFNNPTKKAIEEADNIFGPERLLSILLSFGSGHQQDLGVPNPGGEELEKVLRTMARQSRSVAEELAERFRDSPFYHRFSVDSVVGLCEIAGWTEDDLGAIYSHTRTYMERMSSSLNAVADTLVKNKGSYVIGQLAGGRNTTGVAKSVPRISPYYVERTGVYNFMNQKLVQDRRDGQRIFVLYGMGGVGKTQLASFFVRNNRERYKYVFFVDASSAETIKADLQSAMRSLGGVHYQDTYEDALRFLNGSDNENWLAIFDNADDPQLPLPAFLPESEHGTILITGRNHGLTKLAPTAHWHLQGMEESESIQVLLKAAIRDTSESADESKAARELYNLLGGLPLALVHVGSYCHTTKITFTQYLERFKTHRSKLMAMEPPLQLDKYSYSTYASISLSYSLLDKTAHDLLHLLVFFHPASISLNILRTASKYKFNMNSFWIIFPPEQERSACMYDLEELLIPDGSWDEFRVESLLIRLQSFSLISLFNSTGQTFITIHPLVQSCVRDMLTPEISSHYVEMTLLALSSCSCVEDSSLFQYLPTHISEVEGCKVDVPANNAAAFAYIFHGTGSYAESMRRWENLKNGCRRTNGEEHRSTLWMEYWVANCLARMSKLGEAQTMMTRIAQTQEKVLGEDDYDTLNSYKALAEILNDQRKYTEAEKALRRVLALLKVKYGEENWGTLRTQSSLLSNLFSQGRHSEAELLSRDLLAVMERTLPNNDSSTLQTLTTLSLALLHQHKWSEAYDVLTEAVHRMTITYGKQHHYTLVAQCNLAQYYGDTGEWDEAERILKETLEIQEKILGVDHYETCQARRLLDRIRWQKESQLSTNHPQRYSAGLNTIRKLFRWRL